MTTVIRTARSTADPQTVWEVLTRSAEWASWGDFTNAVRLAEGEGHPDGVGSVREVWTAGLLPAREQVTVFKPEDGIYEYVMLSGLPLKDYVGRVDLTAVEGGTLIRWTASCRPVLPIPGADRFNGLLLGAVLGRMVKALAKEAAARS